MDMQEVVYMKIQWIEFENLENGLKIEKILFYPDVTLLVGLSGVGKTEILYAIEYSLKLAVDKSVALHPYKVNMGISINKDSYEWSYTIAKVKENELIVDQNENYGFLFEQLICNGDLIFKRTEDYVTISGFDKVPKPKKDESLLLQYAEDTKLKNFISEIKKLYPMEIDMEIRRGISKEMFIRYKNIANDWIKKEKNIEFQVFSHLPVAVKLYIVKKYYQEIYMQIFRSIKEIFNEIEDIDVVEYEKGNVYVVSMKVYGKWLLQYNISSGMLKTIYYIMELFTMSKNSLILIDEFENGLGMNCIDTLSECIVYERRDLQFIITSHHPKIINGIEKEKWKIIDRKGSVVKNYDSENYGIGNSQHDAYFNLINRWEYEGKI